jgi:DNA-binding NarL/FixJ family response regulator
VPTRILLIEDFEPFRRFVRSLLETRPEFEVIGEVADGVEAVRVVTELQPDLVLLDVGLPSLDGFSVARRIRSLSSKTKIIFVTQERSADAMDEAALVGSHGYIIKTQALRELLPAIDAACQEKRSATAADRQHWVQFHPDDDSLIGGFASFIIHALDAGKAVRAIVSAPHHEQLLGILQQSGLDIAAAAEQGRYRWIDVAEALPSFIVDGRVSEKRVLASGNALITEAAAAVDGDSSRVAVCGECAPTLLNNGLIDQAIELEHLWDELVQTWHVELLCPYVWCGGPEHEQREVYDKLCSKHAAITWA